MNTVMLKAIETIYPYPNGYRFRSRLEARWAVFFDTLGLQWEYEKEGYDLGDVGWYLPDFWLPQVKMWAEVKPEPFKYQELQRCWGLYRTSGYAVVLLDGIPDFRSYLVCDECESDWLMSCNGDMSRITDGGYPSADYDVFVPWNDVIISTGYLDEQRFYTNTGGGAPWPLPPMRWEENDSWPRGDYAGAVRAARQARFEHGETPCA